MIFNSEYNSSYDNMVVTESPYPLGLEGALMHVYENECNYNAMMKAVGISELRYYQETGGDLFVQEAGAFSGFIAKAKAFFKKVIEKIKQIFHKFMAVINQYAMSDKKFVKTYSKELMRRDYTDFEVEGYTFEALGGFSGNMKVAYEDAVQNAYTNISKLLTENGLTKDASDEDISNLIGSYVDQNGKATTSKDSDDLEQAKEYSRGGLFSGITNKSSGPMDASDFREELKEFLYGDGKETLEIGTAEIRKCLQAIDNAEKDISYTNKIEKKTTSEIDKFIKTLERVEKEFIKFDKKDNEDTTKLKNGKIKVVNDIVSIAQSTSNDVTVAYGLLVQAFKDRNRQSKAICVKALSYKNKNESARLYESSYDANDIFAGVVIR